MVKKGRQMSMLKCGRCGHNGVHAEVIPEPDPPPYRCPTQCRVCRDEIDAAARHVGSGSPDASE